MTVTDPYTGIGVITRGVFDSDMAAISLSLHSSCNDIALNEKNSPSFCQIHFYRGIFHLLSSCTLSTLRAFNSSSFHPSSPQIHPFSMIPVTPQRRTVSIHAPVWVRRASGRQQPGRKRFQFTHPCGCDRTMHGQTLATGSFNSRTRVGATIISDPLCLILEVSIHAPVWVRQDPRDQRGNQQSFNSRTRVGATQDQLARCVFLHVSIHAPVWVRPRWAGIDHHIPRFNSRTRVGATSYQRRYLGLQEVSIHAPVWVRRGDNVGITIEFAVSIHAPVWVRPVSNPFNSNPYWFQFTHPCGCDWRDSKGIPLADWFQFTHPCGCDYL